MGPLSDTRGRQQRDVVVNEAGDTEKYEVQVKPYSTRRYYYKHVPSQNQRVLSALSYSIIHLLLFSISIGFHDYNKI